MSASAPEALFVCLDASVLYDIGELAEQRDSRASDLVKAFIVCRAMPVVTLATLVDYVRGDAPSRAKMFAALSAFGVALCPCVTFEAIDRAALDAAVTAWNQTRQSPAPRTLEPQQWAKFVPDDLERFAPMAQGIATTADVTAAADQLARGAARMDTLREARLVASAIVEGCDAGDSPEQLFARVGVALRAQPPNVGNVAVDWLSLAPQLDTACAAIAALRADGGNPVERLAMMLSKPGMTTVGGIAAEMKGRLDAFENVAPLVAPSLYLKYRLSRHRSAQRERKPLPSDTADEIQLTFAPYVDVMTVDGNVLEAIRGAAFQRVRCGRVIANPPRFNWKPIEDVLFELAFPDSPSASA